MMVITESSICKIPWIIVSLDAVDKKSRIREPRTFREYQTKPSKLKKIIFLFSTTFLVCFAAPPLTWSKPLSASNFPKLAADCAPSVPEQTLEAVAKTESALDSWALHDNTTGASERPASQEQALTDTWTWLGRGDSVDVGLMQINAVNLPALRMTVRDALNPCTSLAGGAAILRAAYGGGKTTADQQAALLMALSRYNTGSPFRGIMNGYARHVMANDSAYPLPAPSDSDNAAQPDPNAPPSWNIWATASYAQTHGAPWLVKLGPSPIPKMMPAVRPAPTSADNTRVANNQVNSPAQPTMRTP
jgi:type IV secretion system protein VirB1